MTSRSSAQSICSRPWSIRLWGSWRAVGSCSVALRSRRAASALATIESLDAKAGLRRAALARRIEAHVALRLADVEAGRGGVERVRDAARLVVAVGESDDAARRAVAAERLPVCIERRSA